MAVVSKIMRTVFTNFMRVFSKNLALTEKTHQTNKEKNNTLPQNVTVKNMIEQNVDHNKRCNNQTSVQYKMEDTYVRGRGNK